MQREDSQRMWNKILAIFIILILLSSSVSASIIDTIWGLITKPLKGVLKSWEHVLKNPKHFIKHWGKHFAHEELEEKGERIRTFAYVFLLGLFTWTVTKDISENINRYILINPDPLHEGVKSTVYSFIHLLIPFYVLALVSLGVYILFLSTSPKGRSRAKSMVSKLIIGMILVTISPHLLNFFFTLSENVTKNILTQGEEEVTDAVGTYTGVMWKSWFLTVGAIYGVNALGDIVTETVTHATGFSISQIKKHHYSWGTRGMKGYWPVKVLGTLDKILSKLKVEAEPGRTIPMLMLSITLFIGVYGILAFRYLMVMFFTLLFPFTIFFLCFDPTKKLGGTLLEQLLLWTFVQEFYAIILVAIGTGMIMLPEDLLGYGFGIWPLTISFFDLAACFTLMLGPIILFMLLRKLLPPL